MYWGYIPIYIVLQIHNTIFVPHAQLSVLTNTAPIFRSFRHFCAKGTICHCHGCAPCKEKHVIARSEATWQSPARQLNFVDAFINIESVGCTMSNGPKCEGSAVQEIPTGLPALGMTADFYISPMAAHRVKKNMSLRGAKRRGNLQQGS